MPVLGSIRVPGGTSAGSSKVQAGLGDYQPLRQARSVVQPVASAVTFVDAAIGGPVATGATVESLVFSDVRTGSGVVSGGRAESFRFADGRTGTAAATGSVVESYAGPPSMPAFVATSARPVTPALATVA